MSCACRSRTRRSVALVSLALLAAGLGGCGGTPDPEARPGSASSADGPTGTADTPSSSASPSSSQSSPRSSSPSSIPATSWGPTLAQRAKARRIVAGMSDEEKAGQVIVAAFDGTDAPTELVRDYHVGGLIVMGYNVASAGQVRDVNLALQEEAERQGRSWPLALGVDQEGGEIARLGAPLTEFPSYLALGAARDPGLAADVARSSGRELRALGFTMVFAPDADVTMGRRDPTIGSRSAGGRASAVADIVSGSLQGYADAGIVSVPKHFPGHGSVTSDSHVGLPVQDASRTELESRDLVPFRAAVRGGASAVMLAHLDVRSFDPGTPSSLSREVVTGLLRKRLGFEGVAVTDALQMGAITQRYGSSEAGVRALRAGVDLLLMPTSVPDTHAAILAALRSGALPQGRLDEAASRVIALMLHQADTSGAAPSTKVLGKAGEVSHAASLAGLTVVSGPCSGRLVGDEVQVVGGTSTDRARFESAAQAGGLEVGSGGDVIRLLGRTSPAGSGDVVVSLDVPYELGRSPASTARIALFGRTPDAFRALVDVLTGRKRGAGHLPVYVSGVDRPGC